MTPSHKFRSTTILVAASMMLATPLTAMADTNETIAVANLVSDAVQVAVPTAEDPNPSNTEVRIPTSSGQDLSLATADGESLRISLPLEVDVKNGRQISDGTTIFLGVGDSPDVAVQPLDDGVRIATVISNLGQTDSFTYQLPADVIAEEHSDGSIDLTRVTTIATDDGYEAQLLTTVAQIEPAWAVDANNNSVDTRYEIANGYITQTVTLDADTVFPVVADPQVTRINVLQHRIRWNRAETKTIANGGWLATGAVAVCAAVGMAAGGPPAAAVFGALCLGLAGSAVYTAGIAENSSPKKCLQLHITYTLITSPIPWFGTYSGGYCK